MGGDNIVIYQAGYKREMRTSSIEEIRKSIQGFQNYLESSDCSDEVYSGKQRERQNRKALEWAVKNNFQLIDEAEFLEKWNKSGNIRGGENRVYFEEDSDGLIWAVKMNELTYHQDDMAAFADRLVKSSEYFPDTTLEIIGMVRTKRGIKPLLRQPFVVTKPNVLAFPVDIWNALDEMGFQLLDPDNEIWLSPDRSYYFSDPGQNNVLVDENGDLAFIDVIFKKVSPEKLQEDYPKLKFVSKIEPA